MALFEGTEQNDTIVGTDGRDDIYGRGGNDSLKGGNENDRLFGGTGEDSLRGQGGRDDLWGGEGNDDLQGDGGRDFLYGGIGLDTLSGGEGDDELDGGEGADLMKGGNGNDNYFVDSLDDVTIESNETLGGYDRVSTSISWTLSENFEYLTLLGGGLDIDGTGNNSTNYMYGNAGNNRLSGMGSSDMIFGGAGDDTLDGGDDDDLLYGETGTDLIIGGNGNDTLWGAADEILIGGAGNDTYHYGTMIIEAAGEGIDSMTLSSDINTSSVVDIPENVENLYFFTSTSVGPFLFHGNDLQNYMGFGSTTANSDMTAYGYGGNDTLESGNNGKYYLDGGSGDDLLISGSRDDTLVGGSGNDTLIGDIGSRSRLEGGDGDDIYEIDYNSSPTTIEQSGGGIDTVLLTGPLLNDWTLGENVENLILSDSSFQTLTGNESDNRIDILTTQTYYNGTVNGLGGDDFLNAAVGEFKVILNGGEGDDRLVSGNKNDTLDGGSGADTMEAGLGSDLYWVDDLNDQVIEGAVDSDVDTIRASVNYTLGANLENLLLVSTINENLSGTGNDRNNVITGTNGSNVLLGFGGNDSLVGNDGNDLMDGGDGVDTLNGGTGADRLQGGSGDDSLDGGLGSDTLEGGDGNDSLVSTQWNPGEFDFLYGGSGNDSLYGNPDDLLAGGTGDDIYSSYFAATQIIEFADEGIDTVHTSQSGTLGANLENLTIANSFDSVTGTGNELSNKLVALNFYGDGANLVGTLYGLGGNDTLQATGLRGYLDGGANNDLLIGSTYADTLIGGSGKDTLEGNGGADLLSGGSGADVFLFSEHAFDSDVATIQDLRADQDLIGIDYRAAGLPITDELSNTRFHAGSAATTADHRLIYDASAGALYYDADGSGATAQELILNVNVIAGTFNHKDIFIYDGDA